jgi:ubiquinone/menaquinone biosynthesis C-methylase UbiE
VPAETYTHGHHESVLRSHRWRTAENSAGYLLPRLVAGASLLDVGCGPGTITLDLARRVAPGRVVGVDAVADVLEAARADAAAAGVDNVSYQVADVYDLPFDDGTFDLVHAHQLLQHLADPVAALREMGRVGRVGGWIAARDNDYAAMTWYPADPRLGQWAALYDAVARRNGGEPDAGRRVLAWARAAGFEDVTPSASLWCYATPEDRAWWGDLWADRVTKSAFAASALDSGLADRADLESIADGWRAWAADPDGWFIVPSGEVLCRRPPILAT